MPVSSKLSLIDELRDGEPDPVLSLANTRKRDLRNALHAHALIYAVHLSDDGQVRELGWHELDAALMLPDGKVWFHLNANDGCARDWIQKCQVLPDNAREILLAKEGRQRVDKSESGVFGVISDLQYGFDFDPEQIATLQFFLTSRRLISTRFAPLSATDQLRKSIRQGDRFDSAFELIVRLFDLQAQKLATIVETLGNEIGDIEDGILKGRSTDRRVELGRNRRLAARLFRHFEPETRALGRLLARPPNWLLESDLGALRDTAEDFSMVVNDLLEVQDRAKLLQEELASRVAEETNRNLYVLSVVTAVMLPVTLVTGIFGMNVAGLPGLENPNAFLWVVVGMIVVGIVSLLFLYRRRMF